MDFKAATLKAKRMLSFHMADGDDEPPGKKQKTKEKYKEFNDREEVDDHDIEEEYESYNPELDSPSSWTTVNSKNNILFSCLDCFGYADEEEIRTAAEWAQLMSNALLLIIVLTGIMWGILIITNTVALPTDQLEDQLTIGGLIIFGSVVGGAVGLILVNVSWSYRDRYCSFFQCKYCTRLERSGAVSIHSESQSEKDPTATKQSGSCSVAQLVSSVIVLFIGVSLIPTYIYDQSVVLLISFGVVLPLLILVNLPLFFPKEDPDQTDDANNGETSGGVVRVNVEDILANAEELRLKKNTKNAASIIKQRFGGTDAFPTLR